MDNKPSLFGRVRRLLAPMVAVLILAWAGLVLGQNSPGGSFQTGVDQIIGAVWTWRGTNSPFIFEGSTDDASETTFTFTQPTADRTVTFQNATGTVALAPAATSGALEAGITALDGSNPTSVTTSLSALAGCTVDRHTSTAPGLGASVFTTIVTATAGRLDIYAWEPTSASDPTLVASTQPDTVRYVCIGTR